MSVDPQTQFNNDYASLTDAVQQYQAAAEAEYNAQLAYNDILTKLKACTTVDQIMVYLEYYLFQSSLPPSDPKSDGCIFGLENDKMAMQGKALAVNSYLTAVHNDMQNIINSDSSDPQQVKNVADDLDKMLSNLDPKNPNGLFQSFSFTDSQGKQVTLGGPLDSQTASDIFSNDQKLRNEFYIAGDTSGYNPAINPYQPSGYQYTYHFVYDPSQPTSPFFLNSFQEMQQVMQTPGDNPSVIGNEAATAAYNNLTNNLNSDTSLTQTVNSALNEKINQLTNFIKTLLGFYQNGVLQPQSKMINAAIQNISKS